MALSKEDLKNIHDMVSGEVDGLAQIVARSFELVEKTQQDHTNILQGHTEMLQGHTEMLQSHTEILNNHTKSLYEHRQILEEHSRSLKDHTDRLERIEVKQGTQLVILRDHEKRISSLELQRDLK